MPVSHAPTCRFDSVLFDLDGTLLDSAPDLAAAANFLRQQQGLEPLPLALYRPMTSNGARGLLKVAFGIKPEDPAYEALKDAFLNYYAAHVCVQTVAFDGVAQLIGHLNASGVPWGIMTNKHSRFAQPLCAAAPLQAVLAGMGCLVSGDTTAHAKPHPKPLLESFRRLGQQPSRSVYIGDDARDIAAGKAAGCATVAVRWGYLGDAAEVAEIEDWGADYIADTPAALWDWLNVRN